MMEVKAAYNGFQQKICFAAKLQFPNVRWNCETTFAE